MNNTETHPFEPFVPQNATTLILGSFPGREQTQNQPDETQWFYGAKKNQFWKIISSVYDVQLSSKNDKQRLFEKHGIGITDIFLRVRRKDNKNSDSNLEIVEYNNELISEIIKNPKIKSIFFTSKFVESNFRKLFPTIKIGESLPSPSPIYFRMTMEEKISHYKSKLPQ